MKEKLQRFMIGRYGIDSFSKFMAKTAFVCILIIMFLPINAVSDMIRIFILALLIYLYFRIFSRNIQKRYQENLKYLQIKGKVMKPFLNIISNIQERKNNNIIYTCPGCKQKIRIPKGKGRICITCPKCRTQFERKS